MFLSFDMSAWRCASASDADPIRQFISGYNGHGHQVYIDGKMLVSTFSGEGCRFGTGDMNTGWWAAIKAGMPATYFVPSFFVDPATFGGYTVMDGGFNVSIATSHLGSSGPSDNRGLPSTVEFRLAFW